MNFQDIAPIDDAIIAQNNQNATNSDSSRKAFCNFVGSDIQKNWWVAAGPRF